MAVSLFYLGRTANAHLDEIPDIEWTGVSISAVSFGIALYVVAIFIWGAGWVVLLRALDEDVGWLTGIVVIGISQVAKYLPGNVAHHIGRVALSDLCGLRPRLVVLSMALEMCWLIAASTACASLALAMNNSVGISAITLLSTWHVSTLMVGACTLPFLVILGLRRWGTVLMGVSKEQISLKFSDAVSSLLNFLSHFINFMLQGLIIVLIARGVFDLSFDAYFLATGVFALAWVAGFLAPGVPAGLGIREAIFAAGLALEMNAGSAIALAVGHRVVTVVGDGVVLALTLPLRRCAITGQRAER